jgi:putative PLP-dependent aminotransferase (TIGR04422 family)
VTAQRFFLWPEPARLTAHDLVGPQCTSEEIEARLRSIFPSSDPVLFSSARAGLRAVLEVLGLSRPDLVWTPPFSSHCVLDAVAHVSTPVPVATDGIAVALVYHQWGHLQHADFPSKVRIIDDCADSLLIPGAPPFSNGSDYMLWSLPKVLATLGGGVVFCRRADDARALRTARAGRPSSLLQAFLRWRSKSSVRASAYWNGAEALQGELVAPLRRQVHRLLEQIHAVAEDRLSLLRNISFDLSQAFERSGRLPSNLPVAVPPQWQLVWGSDGIVSSGLRFFNASRANPGVKWVRVAPLPVHLDISSSNFQQMLSCLNLKDRPHELQII